MREIYYHYFVFEYDHTGEESPSGGTASIFGKDICSNPKAARRHVISALLPKFPLCFRADSLYRCSSKSYYNIFF